MVHVIKISPAFEDERGAIYDLLEKNVRHVGLISSKSGVVRAQHYHKKSTQYTYLLSGSAEFREKDTRKRNSRVSSVLLKPGDLVETPPYVAHEIKFLADSVILDMTTESREDGAYETDTFRVKF